MSKQHLVFLFTLLISSNIQAATFSSSHIIDKGNYSIDTKTGIEWLDLSQTVGLSYNDVSSKMGVGQEFEGWGYATAAQVHTFLDGFGGNGKYRGWSRGNNGLFDAIAPIWGDLAAQIRANNEPGDGYKYSLLWRSLARYGQRSIYLR